MAKSQQVNVRLKRAIEKHFGSVANLCRTWPGCKGRVSEISALIHLRQSPLNRDPNSDDEGNYSALCKTLSEAVGILPEKLFPVKLYAELLHPYAVSHLLQITTVHRLSERAAEKLQDLTLDDQATLLDRKLLAKRVMKVLKTLPAREREIIKLRYGLGDGYSFTLEEVGHIFKVTWQRVRQIEAKAVIKLQMPSRAKRLIAFIGDTE